VKEITIASMSRVLNFRRAEPPDWFIRPSKMPKATKKKKDKAADFSVQQISYDLNQADNLCPPTESQT
jgi:hypothetical protein